MPTAIATTAFNTASGYSASVTNFTKLSLVSDLVFGDNTTARMAQQTPTMTGSVDAGYSAVATIGMAA